MQKIKKVHSSMVIAFITVIILVFTSFGEKNKALSQNNSSSSNKMPIASARVTDPRVIISGFQRIFEPAGAPLTDEQQKRISEVYKPVSPNDNDMREIFGVFTKEQKKVLVDNCRVKLSKSNCPLTKKQESRIMKLKPSSKDKSLGDIYTPEQKQFLIQTIK